jgi:hypothetical protein
MTEELYRQIAAWRLELERSPGRRMHYRLAEALLAVGRPREALEIAEKGLASQPRYLACLDVKGQALLAMHRWREAAAVFSSMAERVDSIEVRRQWATALLGAGEEAQAREIAELILQSNPLDAETRRLLSLGVAALPELIAEDRPLPDIPAAVAQTPAGAPPAPESSRSPYAWPPLDVDTRPTPAPAPRPAAPEKPPPPPAAAEAEPELDAVTTDETDRLVENFFAPLLVAAEPPTAEAPPREPLAELRPVEGGPPAGPPGDGESPAPVTPPVVLPLVAFTETATVAPGIADSAEPAQEYDPTMEMDQDVDVGEVDVFGDIASGHASAAPPAETPLPLAPPLPAEPMATPAAMAVAASLAEPLTMPIATAVAAPLAEPLTTPAAAAVAAPPAEPPPTPVATAVAPAAPQAAEGGTSAPAPEPERADASRAAVDDKQKKKWGFWKRWLKRKE